MNCALTFNVEVDVSNTVIGAGAAVLTGGGIWATLWAARKYGHIKSDMHFHFMNERSSRLHSGDFTSNNYLESDSVAAQERMRETNVEWAISRNLHLSLQRTKTSPKVL